MKLRSVPTLKAFVNNGWNIANRKALSSSIGEENFERIAKLAKECEMEGDIVSYNMVNPYITPKAIQGIIQLLQDLLKNINICEMDELNVLLKQRIKDKSISFLDIRNATNRMAKAQKAIFEIKRNIIQKLYSQAELIDLQKEYDSLKNQERFIEQKFFTIDNQEKINTIKDIYDKKFHNKRLNKLKLMGEKNISEVFMKQQRLKYSNTDHRILSSYSDDARPFNDKLRVGFKYKSKPLLDKIIEKADPLEQEGIVYRAININCAEKYISDLLNGKVVTDTAYMSTGIQIDKGEFYRFVGLNTYILRIHLPKGTKGAYISYHEMLLPRNSQLKMLAFDEKLGIIDCEYILPNKII